MTIKTDIKGYLPKDITNDKFYDEKCLAIRKILERLLAKYPRMLDSSLYKELDRILANSETPFVTQRTPKHLAKMAYSIYLARRKLTRELALSLFKDYFDLRVFPSVLHFTFGSKPVLSILAHAHLKDKYEVLDENQILLSIQKVLSEIEVVKDSVYTLQPSKNTIKTLYFEIYKKNGMPFTPSEIKNIKKLLKEEIRFSIEYLAPRIFMIQNEEEILKSILTLSREIHFVSDPPQVMILFSEQTTQDISFTVITVKTLKPGEPTIRECFDKSTLNIKYVPERTQVIRYLRKKYPIEAHVFKIKIPKALSLLRADKSLNFYLARQTISQILKDVIGTFRDYNGGIIIQQRDMLALFRDSFPDISHKEPDLLENFYYSLSPVEAQAILTLDSLKTLFTLFLEAKKMTFTKPSDSFLKFHNVEHQLFISIRIPDDSFRETVDSIISSFESIQKAATYFIPLQQTYFLGYLLTDVNVKEAIQITKQVKEALLLWKQKADCQQVLKLTLCLRVVSLDPRIGGDQLSSVVLKTLFEGLMRFNREGKLECGIAKDVRVLQDQKTYIFKLRNSLWSDGSSVSAYDFEYAWKKILSPTFKTPFAYLFYPIKNAKLAKSGSIAPEKIGIKAIDSQTLQVELEFPTPYFLELTAHTIYSPVQRQLDINHPNWPFEDQNKYICNGAFKLKKNDFKGDYEVVKNNLYWDKDNIFLDEIKILRANQYESHEMFQHDSSHWIGPPLGICNSNVPMSEKDENILFKGINVYWFIFNTQIFPFNHKKIRQALSWSIDTRRLCRLVNKNPATSPIPPVHSQIKNVELFCLPIAQEQFKKALEELNISLREFPEIILTYPIGIIRHKAACFIKEEWEKALGIRCHLEPLDWKMLFSKLTEGNFQIGGIAWEAWVNDPIYTLNAFRGNRELINFPKWENELYEHIVDCAEKESDLEKRKSYFLEAEKILIEELPVVPLFLVDSPGFKKRNFIVKNISPLMDFRWGYFIR